MIPKPASSGNLAPRASKGPLGLDFEAFWARKSLSEGLTKLPAATWLQERLGGLWGSMLVHLGVHFELPNRSKNDTENKLIFKRFLGPLEIRGSEILMVILTWFGPGGGAYGGATKKAIDSNFLRT